MSGKERREQILNILKDSGKPVPGVELARLLQVRYSSPDAVLSV